MSNIKEESKVKEEEDPLEEEEITEINNILQYSELSGEKELHLNMSKLDDFFNQKEKEEQQE